MLAITHVVVSLLLIQLLTLDRNDAFVAMLFGVFIDLDHLFGLEGYVRSNGVAGLFDVHSLMNPGGQWKSLLHSPMSLAVVGPLSIGWRFAVPLLFWGIHVSMDFAEESFLGNFSSAELFLIVASGAILASIRYKRYVDHVAGARQGFLRHELSEIKATLFGDGSSDKQALKARI